MRLEYLAYRNMISKPMSLVFNLLLLALSVALVSFIIELNKQVNKQLEENIAPVDLVVGAKGSPLQLVLSSVLHIDVPTGNIELKEAKKIMKHPFVGSAVPVAYGDNFKGYRIVGSEQGYFDRYRASLEKGSFIKMPFEIVAGSSVAKKLNLKIGDTFFSSHGLVAGGNNEHEEHPFKVVGVLLPTGSVLDKLLITTLESVWQAHAHEEKDQENNQHESENDEDEREITALLIKFKSRLGLVQLPRIINQTTKMQAALPRFEIQRLEGFLGAGVKAINSIALAVLVVSGISILLSLARAVRERKKELALLRTYGLGTKKLLYLVLIEGLSLAFIGFLLGWLLSRLALVLASSQLESSFGYPLTVPGIQLTDLHLLGATLLIAFIAICFASSAIFTLNISKTLSDE